MRIQRAAWVLCAAPVCLACDQATKAIALRALPHTAPIDLLGGLVQLQLAFNPGGFLSLGASLPVGARTWIFGIAAPLALLVVAWAVARQAGGRLGHLVALSVILAGGLGNLLDRWLHDGSVVDFVSLGLGGLRTGIFNVADVAILAGLLFVVTRGSAERDPP